MDHSERGAKALEASDANTAIVSYTKALIEHPTSPDFFIQRSIAFAKLKPPRYDLALQDAEFAVLCGQSRGRRDKIQAAQHRRMVTYYNLERYADSKLILDSMLKWRPKQEGTLTKKEKMEHDIWSTKINGKLKNQESTIQEYPSIKLPSEKELKAMLQNRLTDNTFDFDGKVETPIPAEPVQTVTQQPTQAVKIRHEWYQNNENVIVTIYAKGVQKPEVNLENTSMAISFPHPSNPDSTYEFTVDPFFALIDSNSSTFNVLSTKIEIRLRKQAPGYKWHNLEGTEPLTASTPSYPRQEIKQISAQAPSYPTSSKSGPKNWDKVASELTKKPKDGKDEDEDSDYGGDAVDGFFKKLYAGSDEATRRAMIKSFTESNGTALSTNWGDVGARHVDPVKSKDEE